MGCLRYVTGLFAGIGGFETGLARSGHVASLFCENDAEATAVLARHFPEVPICLDVRKTDELVDAISRRSDLLTAGFPCTDLSQAGRTEGFAGGRSSLIRDVFKLLDRRPFPHLLIENVPNWRHLHGGVYLREVVRALERRGYRWCYRTIDALAFGLPQRRLRVFLYATLEGDPRDVLFHGDVAPDDDERNLSETAHGFYWTEGNRGLGWGEDCVPPLKGGSTLAIPSPPAILMPDLSIITPDIKDAERLQGFPAEWTASTGLLPNFQGQRFNPRRRWLLVGNAVNVEVSTWIGRQIAAPAPFDGSGDTPLGKDDPWPSAAWFDGKRRWKAKRGTWPVSGPRQSLADLVGQLGTPLSLKATAGFYSRISHSSLNIKDDFKAAVKKHLDRMEARQAATLAENRKRTTLRRVA